MLRFIVPSITLLLALPLGAQAASKNDFELSRMLDKVAKESSVGTPRAINEDILDQGYTVEGKQLIDHLSVRESHAQQMRTNPQAVYYQLGASVCRNTAYRQLMDKGAVMVYEFTEHKTNRPIVTHRFKAADCVAAKKKK
ncbi:quorum-sensing-regulated virulence factor family protein [Pseudomonas akapageensis]|uniref:quorum-sensing-regulated virulence factor family protein n=1 Tax=Pseudomonas akapageensis TaxID=2609961 RepID=UPI00140B45BA|nr:quorum-sensing-regulated virulence factor family protein [Pseudomonas akapageensis]